MLGDIAGNNRCFKLSAVHMGKLHLKEELTQVLGLVDWTVV